jgi:hypothetical protein
MHVLRLLLCLCVLSIAGSIAAQQSACAVPDPQYKINKPNIFTEQQEQWLGEVQADQLESEYYLLPEQDSAELTRIGQRLLEQLPSTVIHFTFRVYLSEEANAFSTSGGYVYVSSKLITDARSEDEVAGVLSHEIGHIYTHLTAITFTRELKTLMNVTAVTDKADIAEKVQLLINAPWKTKASETGDDADKAEVMADSIGLYAVARAGYSPPAFAQSLDRLSDNHGRSVSFFRVLGGADTSLIARVRTARKLADSLSSACKLEKASSSDSFLDFQKKLRNDSFHWQVDATSGLKSVSLTPPIRPSLDEVRFSPDGNYVLAQEESAVHVLSRNPLKRLFTIDAENAEASQFSPDSSRVTIRYGSMRVETWSVATHERESVHELIDYKGCPVHSLSPDGRTYVCINSGEKGIGLTLIDVESEKIYYENKKWDEYPPSWESVKIFYTPDGHTMLIVAGASKAMAYDLDHRIQIALRGSLTDIYLGRVAFVGSNKIAFTCGKAQQQKTGGFLMPVCVANFPTGEKLGQFMLGDQWLEQTTHGDDVLAGPLGDNPAVLFEAASGKPTAAFKMTAVDVYDSTYASETPMGQIVVKELGGGQGHAVDLPVRPLSMLAAGGFSPDGKYLAYSNGSRGVVWDLSSNSLVAVTRPFTSMKFTDGNQILMRLKMAHQKAGTIVSFDLATKKSTEGAKFEKYQSISGGVITTLEVLDKNNSGSSWNTVLHVQDPITGAELWQKKFPHNTPDIYGADDGSLMIVMNLLSQTGENEEGHSGTKLVKTSDVMKEWVQRGLLVEVVNARTGEIQRVIHTPTQPSEDDARWTVLYGNYLAVHGNVNNTVVYRVSDGARTAAFYGRVLAGDGKMGLLAVNNRDQEVIVYNAATGAEVSRVTVDHLPRAARFIPDTNTLLVLTATQRVYSIPLADAKTMTAKSRE